jgi:hypothetical protein
MPETKGYTFSLKEVAEILVKKMDLHEGLWQLTIQFGFGIANVPASPDGKTIHPAVINVVQNIGIQRSDLATNLTIDAAIVNPVRTAPSGPELPLKEQR